LNRQYFLRLVNSAGAPCRGPTWPWAARLSC